MKKIIISLGGSIVVPEKIDIALVRNYKILIEGYVKKGYQFILVVGGGRTARLYQESARKIGTLTRDDLDWLGIHATRINAHFLRTIFKKHAYPNVVTNPEKREGATKGIIVASGWKPGWSTDYVSVKLAKTYNVKTMLNVSNIDYVYSMDPKKNKNAKKLKTMSWHELRKIVGSTWEPGANLPFDPIASKLAEKLGMTVKIVNGKRLSEVKKCIENKPFVGTTIS